MISKKMPMAPRDPEKDTLARQADEAGRLLAEARRMLKALAEEKQVVLIQDDPRPASR